VIGRSAADTAAQREPDRAAACEDAEGDQDRPERPRRTARANRRRISTRALIGSGRRAGAAAAAAVVGPRARALLRSCPGR
jgi:hypothetical protein